MRACQHSARFAVHKAYSTVAQQTVSRLITAENHNLICQLLQRQSVHRPDDIRSKAPPADKKKRHHNKPQPASSQGDEEKHQSENTAGVCVWLKATTYKYIVAVSFWTRTGRSQNHVMHKQSKCLHIESRHHITTPDVLPQLIGLFAQQQWM